MYTSCECERRRRAVNKEIDALNVADLTYNEAGLIPCIVQDASTKDVLMMAWMNAETVQRTLDERTTWFFSRSRNRLWHKGEESGNVQRLVELRYDCDADTLLALVEPAGPACHTGQNSCFYRSFDL
ncbi:MAG: phosphoribosyl-AMP cyclohydrolase [Denitrobacterium detoxificans]|jgi:phosphoribosyl-AMP cyclohydrolase/phosphoribosyl-ATP pyrophosphohydrolase/phosphoribosyl-AMP cyclohydrolase|nr:phosphoribosyl-AMP cyclohydrolase [Denitrobacterium detoxificans]